MMLVLIHLIYVEKDFVALKAKVHKLCNNKLINAPTELDNLKTNLDDLNVVEVKNVPVDLKELSDVVKNQVVKNRNFNKLNTKENNLENKVPAVATLIHINQYNTEKIN